MSGLFRPVVGAVLGEETFRPRREVDLRIASLFGAPRPEVEAPYRESDAERFTLFIATGGEEPVGDFLLFSLILP